MESFTVTNQGSADLRVHEVTLTAPNPGQFRIVHDHCTDKALEPGTSCEIEVLFAPGFPGVMRSSVEVTSNGSDEPLTGALRGVGLEPDASVRPPVRDFGPWALDTTSDPATVTTVNVGTAQLAIDGVEIAGQDRDQFLLVADNCSASRLAPDAACVVRVAFRPTSIGPKEAVLRLATDDPDGPVSVDLAGIGADPTLGYLHVELDMVPNAEQDVGFMSGFGDFVLDDDRDPTLPDAWVYSSAEPVRHAIRQVPIDGWTLSEVACDGETTEVDLEAGRATVTLEPGRIVRCTFVDEPTP